MLDIEFWFFTDPAQSQQGSSFTQPQFRLPELVRNKQQEILADPGKPPATAAKAWQETRSGYHQELRENGRVVAGAVAGE